jgi:hypothetical protein
MDPATLIAVAKDTKAIANFVFGDGLKDTISMLVGDIHLEAAKLALETAIISKNKRDRINSVITHLEAAHSAYSNSLSEYNRTDESLSGRIKKTLGVRRVKIGYNFSTIWLTQQKNMWVCCMMALCYTSLGEPQAAINIISLAEKDCHLKYDRGPLSTMVDFVPDSVKLSGELIANPIKFFNKQKVDYSINPVRVLAEFKSILEQTMQKNMEYFIEERRKGEWVVKLSDESVSALELTQKEAIQRAKQLAPEGVIHVKQKDGKFRRI